jgi:HEXXH motif-containing protein
MPRVDTGLNVHMHDLNAVIMDPVSIPALKLTAADLSALVYGGETQRVPLEKVCAGQLSKHKLLVCAVVRFGARAVPAAGPTLHAQYNLLAMVDKKAPETVAAVLRHPHVGAWAARCMRRLSTDPDSAAADLDYLGAIAVSAAIQAGHACSLTLKLRDGALILPTLGRALLPGTDATITVSGSARATIAAGDHTITISPGPGVCAPGWQAARILTMGDRPLFLDDLDPNRSYDPYPLPGRLDARDVAHWQHALDDAWRLLTEYHPGYAAALYDGLRSLVPIGQRADERNVSATSGDAFGAVAASRPSDGAALAVALMHEFQHAKLCAITDLEPLFDRHTRYLFYAPWRPDPRPVGALLHGIFAHMAVVDFWRVHRLVTSGQKQLVANVEFARWLQQTHYAARLLEGHDALTAAGRRLLSQVTARLADWLSEPVPGPERKLAVETSADHLSGWRLRNLGPDPGDIERLARDWLAGRPGHGSIRTRIREDPLTADHNVRPDLLYLRLCDPARFERDHAASGVTADVAYARGDHTVAARGYLAELRTDPARLHAWTGLGLTTDLRGPLSRCPEVAYALHDRIRQLSGTAADPLLLASWLDSVSTCDLGVQV